MNIRHGLVGAIAAALMVASANAQDAKTQTHTARGLTLDAPAAWKKMPVASQMRALQLKIDPVEGDKDAGELVLFAFPGGAGGVQANVDRWKQQFQDDKGKAPEVKTEKIQGKNVEVTFVETAGRYVAAMNPGQPEKFDKPGYRLLGAIVTTSETGYFIKAVGPDKTMSEAKEAFLEMAKSMKVGE